MEHFKLNLNIKFIYDHILLGTQQLLSLVEQRNIVKLKKIGPFTCYSLTWGLYTNNFYSSNSRT